MSEIYDTPQAELEDPTTSSINDYYIVGTVKFWVLMVSTLGLYAVYWFYANWKAQKIKHEESTIPVLRGIFSIFFTHSLFKRVDESIKSSDREHKWSPNLAATGFVLFTLLSTFIDRMVAKDIAFPILDIVSLSFIFITAYFLYLGQGAINFACDDPKGSSNANFTPLNWLWVVIGLGFWGLIIAGLFFIAAGL